MLDELHDNTKQVPKRRPGLFASRSSAHPSAIQDRKAQGCLSKVRGRKGGGNEREKEVVVVDKGAVRSNLTLSKSLATCIAKPMRSFTSRAAEFECLRDFDEVHQHASAHRSSMDACRIEMHSEFRSVPLILGCVKFLVSHISLY